MSAYPLDVGDRVSLRNDENRLRGTIIDTKTIRYGIASNRYFAHVCWDDIDGHAAMTSQGVPLGSQWLPTTAVRVEAYAPEAVIQ